MTAPTLDRETILRAVQKWPVSEQVALADAILNQAQEAHTRPEAVQPPAISALALRGIASSGQPAPADDEIARGLEEERMRKYGE